MTQIEILNSKRYSSYVEISYKMRFILPAIYGTGAAPIEGLSKIIKSYGDNYSTEIIPVTGTVITYTETSPIDLGITLANAKTQLQTKYASVRATIDGLALSPYDSMTGLSWDGTTWAATNLITDAPIINTEQANLSVTATGIAAAAVTLTLPAAGAGKFHNITHISIQAYSTAARTGNATPILVTTTNIAGSPVFTFATAAPIGSTDMKIVEPRLPVRSLVSNTATTIVCPGTAGIIWRVNVFYNTNL